MPFIWDDPTNPEEVGQLAVDLGNGAVRGKLTEMPQVPLTGCLVTANFDLSSVARYSSRLCILKMEKKKGPKQPGVASELESLAVSASAALPILLNAIHNLTPADIHVCTRELMDRVPCDLRIVEGLAVPLTVAKKVLEMTNMMNYYDDVEVYLDQVLFPYITECMPGNQNTPNIIIEKMFRYENQIFHQSEVKDDQLRVVRSFLVEVVGVTDSTLSRLRKEGLGEPSKVVRLKGSLVRAVVINIGVLREDHRDRILRLMSGEVVNDIEEAAEELDVVEVEPAAQVAEIEHAPEVESPLRTKRIRRRKTTSRSCLRQTRSMRFKRQ